MSEDKTVKGILHGVPVTVTIKGKPDYTPTTEEVRGCYLGQLVETVNNTFEFVDEGKAKEEFDRWLAEVLRDAKAEAWDIGYKSAERNAVFPDRYVLDVNPYRQGGTE